MDIKKLRISIVVGLAAVITAFGVLTVVVKQEETVDTEEVVIAALKSKFAPLYEFDDYTMPDQPDYRDNTFWAALPEMEDNADNAPAVVGVEDKQAGADVDVFYVHPTTFLNKAEGWTADAKSKIQLGPFDPLHLQASVFNGSARIYAPRYRQATLFSFFDESGEGKKALAIAQKDIIDAFIYYLAHYNQGRPFIIAGHSQGSLLLIPVLRYLERYPTDKFIVAYVPGWSISSEDFDSLKPCDSPTQLQCFNVWNAKHWGSLPEEFVTTSRYVGADCVNPISWKNNEVVANKDEHLGGIDIVASSLDKNYARAKCHGDMLWVDIPDNPKYQSTLNKKNYHLVDYGLFYLNIRENIQQRIDAYRAQQ